MGGVMQLLYLGRRTLFRALNLHTRGIKVMLFNRGGELLLVRNSYGNSDQFGLPGGGIKRHETPEAAAAREVREEAGVEARELALVSTHFSTAEGWSDTIFLFTGKTDQQPVADGREVAEARFFALDRLPENISSAALRRIAEHRGERSADGSW